MRAFSMALAFAILLSGCQTTKRPPIPAIPTAGNGGVVVLICVNKDAAGRTFTLRFNRTDPLFLTMDEPRPRMNVHYESASFLTLSDGLFSFKSDPTCQERYFEVTPGPYVLSDVWQSQQIITTGTGQINFINTLFPSAIGKKNRKVSEHTLAFNVKQGEITRIGSISFLAENLAFHVPVKDNTGYWDGQTTETHLKTRVRFRYEPAPLGEITAYRGARIMRMPSFVLIEPRRPPGAL